jgi:glycosyltransferase involved in cell wall biosynthesis
MRTVGVVIPSRSQPQQSLLLNRAIASISKQTAQAACRIEVVVSIDKGAAAPVLNKTSLPVRLVESEGRNQAAALNAGVRHTSSDYISFLEDDDQWLPEYLEAALVALSEATFVSSTQLESDASGRIVRINDFATPSGWSMPRSTWDRVGPFDEGFRWHLDNDWLGRLTRSGTQRIHMIEATAPLHVEMMKVIRPWLYSVLESSGPSGRVMRHSLLVPLVNRLVHERSGTHCIAADPAAAIESEAEHSRLIQRFGHIPW